jgi:hypothetical protein
VLRVRTPELIQAAREHVARYRENNPGGELSPEMLTMELMATSLESHMLINLRCEHAIHEQIKILEGVVVR